MKILLLSLLPALLFAESLRLCFKAYYLIIPVGYSCIEVKSLSYGKMKVIGETRSLFLGSLFRKIEIKARSELEKGLSSEKFTLYLKSGEYIKKHFYAFRGNVVNYEIRVEKSGKVRTIKGRKRVRNNSDPLTASLYVYLAASFRKRKHVFFYDGREQLVEFIAVGREKLKRLGRDWKVIKIKVIPKVKTSGILIPRGTWFVWVDENTRIPVRMKVNFTLGSANAWIDSIEGNSQLFLSLRDRILRTP